MIEGINPTRMELLKLKDREKLAVKGHSLLKEKRNALIMEFFNILERVKGSRENVEKQLAKAYKDLATAQVTMGDLAVRKASLAVKESVEVDIDSRSVMGVVVPVIESKTTETRTMVERGYGFVDTSVKLDEAAKNFEESIKLIIELGEIEKTILLLAKEIESTKRRVNALEHIIIPRIENTVKYIEMRLEEMERENFVRLKMIKKTMEME
jgi:V/A-type H+-transporting ATPase subunit D